MILNMSHKTECSNADPDRRWKNRAQGRKAGPKRRAGGENIIKKNDVPDASPATEDDCSILTDSKSSSDIARLFLYIKLGLCLRPPLADEDVRAHGYGKFICDCCPDHFRLIISSFPFP